jgi:hypothetical protein
MARAAWANPDESRLVETALRGGSDRFDSSANPAESQLAESSTGPVVEIVLAAVAAVALVVGLIAWRYCSVGAKAVDPGPARAVSRSANPKAAARADLSDELMDDQCDSSWHSKRRTTILDVFTCFLSLLHLRVIQRSRTAEFCRRAEVPVS